MSEARGPVATDRERTTEALERYRRRAGILAMAGMGLIAAAIVLGVGGFGGADSVSPGVVGVGIGLACIGLGALVLSRRMRRTLSAHPWQVCTAVPVPRSLHAATVVLADPATGDRWPLKVVAVKQRYGLVDPGPAGVLWWAGDPRTGGVLAPPGGDELIWAKPVRGQQARFRLVREAEALGLSDRADGPPPPLPRPATMPTAPNVPTAPSGAATTAAGRGRRLGIFRWALLLGVVCLGLGIAGSNASDHDPQIDLTVLSEEADGPCVVRWTDPFDGRERTGPYHCDPDRDPLLHDWETGFVVSYGPWKGDLYNWNWEGTRANHANEAVALTGLALTPLALIGGAVRWWTRRRSVAPVVTAPHRGRIDLAKRPPHEADPAPPLLTYAVFAAEAERQAIPQPGYGSVRRPEADVREVPWWRVRGLRAAAGLERVAGAAALIPLAAVLWPLGGTAQGLLTGGAGLALLLYAGWGTLTRDMPAARLLARAAVAPDPVPKRYALLHDPYGGTPLLLLFPADGGDDDPPEAVLTLLLPGTRKRPWLGLPAAAVGTAELRGLRDDLRFAVPWIEGRAHWPQSPYEELRPDDPETREFLERLAAGAAGWAPAHDTADGGAGQDSP
ncbi:hypothetical protein ACIQ7Q_07225 [Streptomyces sp. NPDC096176]|uniref:hypothetical protein n=1 Tax=Streptomyces sp. NPDC096176 TaxID=3366079 RepID=UPI003825743C